VDVTFLVDCQQQEVLGIDTRDVHFAKVRAEPLKSSSWYRLLQQTQEDQIEEVLSFAEQAIPLAQIASGPADALGLGEKYAAHSALDWILQDLKRFPQARLEISGGRPSESGHQKQKHGSQCAS
jgi:hypothetical protein